MKQLKYISCNMFMGRVREQINKVLVRISSGIYNAENFEILYDYGDKFSHAMFLPISR